MSNNSLLHFLSSEDVSNTLLYWINCFPFKSCREVKKLTDLRDTVALSEILVNVDENYFKDLMVSQGNDKNLWLLNLVQLKKLFLKLSAYVELYMKQDWSLLPVPDFKLVSRSEEQSSHLNFMVAAVLLTATHSGKNFEYQKILEFSIPSSIRRDIQTIQDSFLIALEPKSPKASLTNSPRKTSLIISADLTPRALFPSKLSIIETKDYDGEFEIDIKLQEIQEIKADNKLKDSDVDCVSVSTCSDYVDSDCTSDTISHSHSACSSDNNVNNQKSNTMNIYDQKEFINLQNEVQLLEIKLTEMEKSMKKSQNLELLQQETLQTLTETRQRLRETCEELRAVKERQEYEKIERNSLLAAFDLEKQILDDQIEVLKQEMADRLNLAEGSVDNVVINHNSDNESHIVSDNTQDNNIVDNNAHDNVHDNNTVDNTALYQELNQSKSDNSKLVKALIKARDHIINQDALIKELKGSLDEKENAISSLKASFELERISMNRILTDLGSSIQRKTL